MDISTLEKISYAAMLTIVSFLSLSIWSSLDTKFHTAFPTLYVVIASSKGSPTSGSLTKAVNQIIHKCQKQKLIVPNVSHKYLPNKAICCSVSAFWSSKFNKVDILTTFWFLYFHSKTEAKNTNQ